MARREIQRIAPIVSLSVRTSIAPSPSTSRPGSAGICLGVVEGACRGGVRRAHGVGIVLAWLSGLLRKNAQSMIFHMGLDLAFSRQRLPQAICVHPRRRKPRKYARPTPSAVHLHPACLAAFATTMWHPAGSRPGELNCVSMVPCAPQVCNPASCTVGRAHAKLKAPFHHTNGSTQTMAFLEKLWCAQRCRPAGNAQRSPQDDH